jgi:pantoate--beta-alanine ligase
VILAVARTTFQLRDAITAAAANRSVSGSARVGFVPTMGFLHDGHATLIRRARSECDVVVVSIFVNPAQFGPNEDFGTYPRDIDRDLALLEREHADVAFVPDAAGIYPPGAEMSVTVGSVAEPLDGESRPGHFRGVALVVKILLAAVQPARAYFGEKDWQQLQVVRHLVRDLQMPLEIVSVPTMREADGLAMSSRNSRLSSEARIGARCMPRALEAARAAFAAGETRPDAIAQAMSDVIRREPAATLDYAVVVNAGTLAPIARAEASTRALIAARVGGVRLIDNSALRAS